MQGPRVVSYTPHMYTSGNNPGDRDLQASVRPSLSLYRCRISLAIDCIRFDILRIQMPLQCCSFTNPQPPPTQHQPPVQTTTPPRFRSSTLPTERADGGGGGANGHEEQTQKSVDEASRDKPPTHPMVRTARQPQENVSSLVAIGAHP